MEVGEGARDDAQDSSWGEEAQDGQPWAVGRAGHVGFTAQMEKLSLRGVEHTQVRGSALCVSVGVQCHLEVLACSGAQWQSLFFSALSPYNSTSQTSVCTQTVCRSCSNVESD